MMSLLLNKVKYILLMVIAVISTLLTAYGLGSRSARKAYELKHAQDDRDRLYKTVVVKNEVKDDINKMSPGVAHNELNDHWMRQ